MKTLQGLGFILALFILSGLLILLESPTGSLKAVVVDEAGLPVVHATVNVDSYPTERKVFSDATGAFSAARLPVRSYYVNITAKGYQAEYLRGQQKVVEGQVTDLGRIVLRELAPSLSVSVWDQTKTPREKINLSLSGAKVRDIHFTAYRVDLLQYLNAKQPFGDLEKEDFDPTKATGLSVVQDFSETIPDEDIREFNRKVKTNLQDTGLYLIHSLASSTDRKFVFTRNLLINKTDVGFVAKRDANQLLIYASTFIDPHPLEGAKVGLLFSDGKTEEKTTDRQGIANFPISSPTDPETEAPWIIVTSQNGVAYMVTPREILDESAGEFGGEGETEGEGEDEATTAATHKNDRVFLYTERPLYRPGQKVYFKGIARAEKADGSYDLTAPMDINIQVQNPKGDNIYETTLHTNNYGSIWGEFDLEEEADIGYYTVLATIPGKEFRVEFSVEEYRKPEFKVEIKPDKPRYYGGDKITYTIDAQYYFGAPVEAKIEYVLYKSEYYYPDEADSFPSYNIHEEEFAGGYGEVVEEGNLQTDATGRAFFSFTPKDGGIDQRYTLRVTAKDMTEKTVTTENDAIVVGGDFFFRTKRTEFLAFAKKTFPLVVATKDYDGKPVSRDFELKVEKEKWDPIDNNYDYKKVAKVEGKTGADGLAQTQFTLDQGGYYRLVLSGKDSQGRKVVYYDYLWAAGSAQDTEGYWMEKNFTLIPEKKKYEAGQTAKLLVVGPEKDGSILVTVEGARIHEYHVEKLDGFSKVIEIPLKKEWIPNVFINVSAIGKKEYYEEFTELSINPSQNFLTVDIEPNAEKWQPAQDVSYKVTTKDSAGKPVPAEISLGVVDESLYALKADHTDIKNFFWGPRPNRVGSNYSFSGYYTGGIEKDDKNLLRRNFKDTAFWAASVVTDDQGQATLSFKLPDNLTTWRATVIAQTLATDVGQSINKVISTKPLIVRLATPRFFMERDQITLKAIVHNYTDQAQTLNVALGVSGIDFMDPKDNQTRSVTIQPKQAYSFDFTVLPKVAGEAKLQLLAKNDAVNDGLELKIPVLAHGLEEHQYQEGEIAAAQPGGSAPIKVTLNLPPATKLEDSRLKVTLDTTMVARLLGSLAYLVEYPYGCVEQTTSRILSAVAVANLYKSLGLTDSMLEKKVPKVITKGIKRILMMHHSDGGWGWWVNDDTDPFMTSYAMYGLLRIKALGQEIPEETLESGRESLKKQLKEGLPQRFQNSPYYRDLTYFIHYVASLAGIKNNPPMPGDRPLETQFAQAMLILTLEAQGKHDKALPLLKDLERKASCQGDLCHYSDGKKTYRGDAEVTGWALQALIAGHSEDQVLKDSIVKWLFKVRQGGMWRHTQETATVLYALTEYARSLPGIKAGVYVKLLLNDQDLETVRVASPHFVRKVQQPKFKEGRNFLGIVNFLQNTLYYQSDLQYFTQQEDLLSSSNGIKVQREYVRLKPVEGDNYGEKTYEASPLKGKINKGEIIGVRISIEAPEELTYVVMEDPLPSGFEVMEDIRFDKDAAYYADLTIRDEKVALFGTYMEKGKHVYNYALRPELSGKFHVMPAESYEMYRPEVKGTGAEARLEVE